MTREERLDWLCRLRSGLVWFDVPPKERPVFEQVLSEVIKALEQEPCEDAVSRQAVSYIIKSHIGEELRKVREGITDENVLIGFNMAIAICNKYLAESEDKE